MPAVRPAGRPYPGQNGAQAASSSRPTPTARTENELLSLNDALYNHLVLPPQLPHRQDSNLNEIENAITDRLLASVKHLRDLPNNDLGYVWSSVERGLLATKSIHSGGHVDRTSLVRELNDVFGESDFLVVYVRSQNCALYIHRSQDPVLGASVVFEAFETSARNEDVLATDNALQWDFPGCAVAVPLQTYRDDGFISTLANFLDNASRESLADFSAHALKAGTSMPEYRNTSEPALVSSMLMAILQQNGRRLAPTLLQKMVRDDVCWKNAEKPWKRLPYWLVLRVAISRYLSQRLGGEIGRLEYKFLLAHLFSEFLTHIQRSGIRIDRLDFLKKKICRRLVKLDVDNDRSQSSQVTDRIECLFLGLSPGIKNSVSRAALFIEASWKQQKLTMTKSIPPLPRQAAFRDMQLDLKASGQYLHKIWKGYSRPIKFNLDQQNSVSVAEAAKQHLMSFALEHFKLIKKETTHTVFCDEISYSPRSVIEKASSLVNNYLVQASEAYQNIPELKSTLILNVMDLWVSMDKAACNLYPILREFHPVFRPEMLDVLLLSTVTEMKRLQEIQVYLQDRIAACESPVSILDDPVRGSFGNRLYDSSDMSDEMKDLHESIETWATNLRNAKEQEWKTKSQEYTRLSKSVDESTCVYSVDDNNPLAPGHHDPDCRRCYLKRQLARIRIQAYEHPLPSDPFVAKSVIFELVCPQTLATYRDVTWTIMARLALQGEEGIDPKCWVRDYQQLHQFSNDSSMSCSLASVTKPSLQCGPLDSSGSVFRLIHEVFHDSSFCKSLLQQLSHRLDSLFANWRETYLMETVITLTLRMLDFSWEAGLQDISEQAMSLLLRARNACVRWFKLLRTESYKVNDAEAAQRFQQYSLWAALLCKRTFTPLTYGPLELDDCALETYIQSSIMLNDNLVVKLEALPQLLQHAIIRDIRLSYRLAKLVSERVLRNPEVFRLSLREMWPEEEGCPRAFYQIQLEPEALHWISCRSKAAEDTNEQTVFYNCVQGVLLVDGRPIGKLPEDPNQSLVLNELFGNQNLRNGEVLITGRDRPWPDDNFKWYTLSLKDSTCARPRIYKGALTKDYVINTSSPLFSRVTRILDSFEDRDQILVYQPGGNRSLTVELKRLNILFYTNRNRLLESPQLQCQIDINQDAGTWYGLRSKLVCTSLTNPTHRFVLVPLGPLSAQSEGCHVAVRVQPNGKYGRFSINTTLGRIDCAPEPTLVFMKALLHASTTFLLPDPLTGRTGTEEAIQWLQAGISQPWSPLTPPSIQVLQKIAQLTPRRVYYPADLKVMRTDYWIESLPSRLQSSEFRPIVDQILQESATLSSFVTKDQIAVEQQQLASPGESHLHSRAIFRQNAVERHLGDASSRAQPVNQKYISRDRPSTANIMHRNVLEVTQLIHKWPKNLKTTDCLAQLLSQGSTVGGFLVPFEAASLNQKLKVNLLQCWGSLIRLTRDTTDRYKLMYLFGPMSFHLDANMPLLRTLIASAVFGELKELELPQWDEFDHFQPNQTPQLDYLLQLLKPHKVAPPEDDALGLGQYSSGKLLRKLQIERAKHESKVEEDCKFLANHLLSQWPCLEPNVGGLSRSLLIDIGPALEVIRPEWKRLFMNRDLAEHLNDFQAILDRRTLEDRYEPPPVPTSEEAFPVRIRGGEIVDLRQLLAKPYSTLKTVMAKQQTPVNSSTDRPFLSASDFPQGFANFTNSLWTGITKRDSVLLPTSRDVIESVMKLHSIAQRLGESKSAVRGRYAKDFQKSLAAFQRLDNSQNLKGSMKMRDSAVELSSEVVENGFVAIRSALDTPNPTVCSQRRILWLKAGDLWPIVTKATLLSSLGSVASTAQGSVFGSGMRKAIVGMGVNITKYQREVRLHDLALKKATGRYHEEESNKGHSNWSPEEYPDWLLLEIESNIMIRPVQIDVALATISPVSGSNSVLQMNMGQGKTSCIIPMAAAALANKKQLVRVIVPKALLQQTAQLLQARLGGILGRGIRHVPFSRRTPTTEKNIRAYHSIHREMLKSAGIMICQPEHHMSFMLSGRQRLLDEQPAQAGPMIKVQEWLTRISRDILDESDYTLAVRTQLIYPSGSQTTVDGHPHRWLVAEAVLRLVDSHLHDLSHVFPHSISVIRRKGGGFPFVFFLRQDVEDELVNRLTADICRGAGGILPMTEQAMATKDRVAVKDFISSARPQSSSISLIRTFSPDKPSLRQTIYLLRGLLVNRILMMTLKKRWNVEYGLHPQRDPIAVPFHAKGVPSDQSEWGHPDVAILFTCLAFYYDGVNPSQLRQSLEHILKSDDPSTEYDNWTKSTENFPSSLKAWNSINVDDEMQLGEIWKVVRYNEVVVDYFLNNFVFPRHAKQFEVKLQSNGWDIPLSPLGNASDGQSSSEKPSSTGFSGTNDNRTMLPLNIEQHDLPSLHHTSAEVLTYLLHPRNRRCILPQDVQISAYLGRSSEMDLLNCLKAKSIHVLIDAGAQILEMDNITLVEHWLRVDTYAVAGLYFDEDNKPWILTREGRKTPLLASPFADDLTKCLIYLDEAHTRGTDLRLPPDAKGALTLRLGQTKDHTVQAAMRLRQLGTTQAISFFIPPEVHQSIADLQNKTMHEFIDSSDVIQWLLDNTCDQIEQLQPLYYSQGIDYCRRMQAALDYPNFLTDRSQRKSYVQAIKQDEQQSLQNLYEPKTKSRASGMQTSNNEVLKGFIQDLNARKKTFQDTGKAVHASALQEVEQEREVAFEVESVRQVKKPQHYTAYSFPGLNPSLETFIRTGRLPADTNYFIHVFHALARTGTGRKFKVNSKATNSKLLETVEFGRTIKPKGDLSTDNFLRPVNWILWSPVAEIAIVIMPEEAEALIPIMRDPNSILPTHLLVYSAPITRKMLQFNDLTFHSIPPLPSDWKAPCWLQNELGIYAGRLYFEWSEYEDMCALMGIQEGAVGDDEMVMGEIKDGPMDDEPIAKVKPESHKQLQDESKLAQNPLTFLQEWLAVRRRGQDFAHSPMGFVSQGKRLQGDHIFFKQAEHAIGSGDLAPLPLAAASVEKNDRDDGYYGVDDMGANEAGDSDASDDDIEYDESEYADSASLSN
ncbi:hypothetical protein ACHAPQ_002878 [Fusarium lateritium]